MLLKTVRAEVLVVLFATDFNRRLLADILGTAVVRCDHRSIVWPAVECGAIVVIERRNRQKYAGSHRMHPGKIHKFVAFVLRIGGRGIVGSYWNLKIIIAN